MAEECRGAEFCRYSTSCPVYKETQRKELVKRFDRIYGEMNQKWQNRSRFEGAVEVGGRH